MGIIFVKKKTFWRLHNKSESGQLPVARTQHDLSLNAWAPHYCEDVMFVAEQWVLSRSARWELNNDLFPWNSNAVSCKAGCSNWLAPTCLHLSMYFSQRVYIESWSRAQSGAKTLFDVAALSAAKGARREKRNMRLEVATCCDLGSSFLSAPDVVILILPIWAGACESFLLATFSGHHEAY